VYLVSALKHMQYCFRHLVLPQRHPRSLLRLMIGCSAESSSNLWLSLTTRASDDPCATVGTEEIVAGDTSGGDRKATFRGLGEREGVEHGE
jgi:hypothetical protein